MKEVFLNLYHGFKVLLAGALGLALFMLPMALACKYNNHYINLVYLAYFTPIAYNFGKEFRGVK
jgi:hypothetical protein